ncbi:unnamed protein product [Ectocarpus sp. 6 AP-2014]
MRKAGEIVRDIQTCSDIEEALQRYTAEAASVGLSTSWIESVFKNKRPLPVLDASFDVHGTGVNILDTMGIAPATQKSMWDSWALLDDDVKASWVKDFKSLDFSEPRDVVEYTTLLVNLLSN